MEKVPKTRNHNVSWTCPEHTKNEEEAISNNDENNDLEIINNESPVVPDRKMKPKFLYILKNRRRQEDALDGDWCGLEDNASLLSGVQRLSWSPAPTPAPRKSVPNGVQKMSPVKHTYQNVPIPISPNNSQTSIVEKQDVDANAAVRPIFFKFRIYYRLS